MSTSAITNELKFAWTQTYDVFCDRLHLYRQQFDESGAERVLEMAMTILGRLEKEKSNIDVANRLFLSYQMILNLSILADIASEADLSRFDAEKLQKIYRSTIKTISGQIKPSYGESLCDLSLVAFNDLLRSVGGDDMRRAEYALVGVVRAYRMYQRVAQRETLLEINNKPKKENYGKEN